MGNIPAFNRVITPDRAVGGAAIEVARAPGELKAQAYRSAGNAVGNAAGQAMDYMARVQHADNATWVNAQSVAYRKHLYDGMDQMRKSRESSPTNFHKDFDAAMETAGQDFLGTAPTDAARSALQEQMADMRTAFYDNNIQWETQRNTSIFAERMDDAADNMGSIAYRAGLAGEPLDSSGIFGDVEASVVTGSSFVVPEKLGNIRDSMRKGVMQNYLQGLSDAHPVAALKALDSPEVQAQFKNPEEFAKMKTALESRASRVQEVNGQKEVLGILKDENSLLARSLSDPLSYGDLEKEFARQPGMSLAAKSYFMKANGFDNGQPTPLTPAAAMTAKSEIYEQLAKLTAGQQSWGITNAVKGVDKMELTPKVMSEFQNTIYSAMNSKVLTDDEGMMMLGQVMEPFADQNAEALERFSDNPAFDTNVGLDGLERVFKDKIQVPVPDEPKEKAAATAKYAYNQAKTINAANRVKLYDYYLAALGDKAKEYGVERIGDIPQLNGPQKRKLFTEAQGEAERLYMLDKHPALSTLKDIPNQVFSNGQLIPGAAGKRDINPDGSAHGKFQIITKGGHKARRYEDGTIEVLE